MFRFLRACLLAPVLAASAAAQVPYAPQLGVLVLRNGQVLQGEITRTGDYYVVTLGPTGEVRLPARDVETQCRSLDEAYGLKSAALAEGGAVGPRLDLAEWCVRHGLLSRAADQLRIAIRQEPEHPRVAAIEQRLLLSVQKPPPPPAQPAAAAPLSIEQLEAELRKLPAGSVEKFASVVQPILLNRCGAGHCHGPTSTAEFKLIRPPTGLLANRRFTQRNLYAALQQVNLARPDESPLLLIPQQKHGSTEGPMFDKHSRAQLEHLAEWVKQLSAPVPAAAPPTIAPQTDHLSQSTSPAGPAAEAPRTAEKPVTPDAAADAGRSAAAPDRFVPRDPFDPEIFNRRFHPRP